ncbi:MAG: UTP--glucose-1-phosphate uridylyltransferase GalU [Magnetococcales bacterium]|nr:UTP--glucose-1-phosphate uridylyltransferase GalU [Magnetococcales bacterium]
MKLRTVVIPVAGLGTRFLPATKTLPKEMLPVVDKPLIQYAVEEAWAAGMERIVFVTGRGKKILEDHFDHSPELEETLIARGKDDLLAEARSTIPEAAGTLLYTRQNRPLGLGHAVWCGRNVVGNEPFAVILPDDLIDTGGDEPVLAQMAREFEQRQSSIVAVMPVDAEQTSKYGIVAPLDREVDTTSEASRCIQVEGLVEKPLAEAAPSNLAVIGRYILTPEIFHYLERRHQGVGGEVQLTDAIAALLEKQAVYAYRFRGTRFDCGDKVGFQMANVALSLQRPQIRERLLPFLGELLARELSPSRP